MANAALPSGEMDPPYRGLWGVSSSVLETFGELPPAADDTASYRHASPLPPRPLPPAATGRPWPPTGGRLVVRSGSRECSLSATGTAGATDDENAAHRPFDGGVLEAGDDDALVPPPVPPRERSESPASHSCFNHSPELLTEQHDTQEQDFAETGRRVCLGEVEVNRSNTSHIQAGASKSVSFRFSVPRADSIASVRLDIDPPTTRVAELLSGGTPLPNPSGGTEHHTDVLRQESPRSPSNSPIAACGSPAQNRSSPGTETRRRGDCPVTTARSSSSPQTERSNLECGSSIQVDGTSAAGRVSSQMVPHDDEQRNDSTAPPPATTSSWTPPRPPTDEFVQEALSSSPAEQFDPRWFDDDDDDAGDRFDEHSPILQRGGGGDPTTVAATPVQRAADSSGTMRQLLPQGEDRSSAVRSTTAGGRGTRLRFYYSPPAEVYDTVMERMAEATALATPPPPDSCSVDIGCTTERRRSSRRGGGSDGRGEYSGVLAAEDLSVVTMPRVEMEDEEETVAAGTVRSTTTVRRRVVVVIGVVSLALAIALALCAVMGVV